MTTKELQDLVAAKQTGVVVPTADDIEKQKLLAQKRAQGTGEGLNELRGSFPVGTARNENVGMEAAYAGWGESRYDRGAFNPEVDLEHKRAIEQSGFSKLLNGAIKGGVVAATTAVETTAGVIDGIFEGLYELSKEAESGEGLSASKIIGAGVNNTVARSMVNIQRLADEWFPNYRTLQERSDKYQDEWYKHIFTANFIGDSFLKNFGFTVGAMAGGAAWSKVISAGLRAAAANNLMRGVVAAAEGSSEARSAVEGALKLVNEGAINAIDDPVVIRNLQEAAKSLNRMSTRQQLIGGVISAVGEGTMEGVMARNEFIEGQLNKLNQNYISSLKSIERDVIAQFKDNKTYVHKIPAGRDPGGNLIFDYELTPDGQQIVEDRKRNLAEDYRANRDFMEELGDRVAATTFAWNIPVLTVSNTLQYGRMLSGGFKTTRNTASKVVGGTVFREGKPVAEYAAKGTLGGRIAANIARNGSAEAAEEMAQGFISSGAKNVADHRLTSFNDDGYDYEEMFSTANWIRDMLDGGMDYLKEGRNWQEGFLGMITGLIGIPGRQWNGGIPEAIREAKSDFASSQAAADALNNTINSDRFQKAWQGYIRHQKYETEMGDAISRDDQYSWKTANDKQLVSDILMFADAGRLNDLKDIVTEYSKITVSDDKDAVEAATSAQNEQEVKNNPEAKVKSIQEQAQDILKTIDLYNDIYTSMTSLAPVGTSDAQIKEMMATMMNIKAFETRFLSMFNDVLANLSGFVDPIASVQQDNEQIQDEKKTLENKRNIYSALAQAYTNLDIPLGTSESDAFGLLAAAATIDKLVDQYGNDELKQKYSDMKKVAADRKAYVKKLITLRDLPVGKFDEQAMSADKAAAEIKKQKAQEETEPLKTLDDVKKAYFEKDAKGRADFMTTLEDAATSNPNIDKFVKLKKRYDKFMDWLNSHPISSSDITVTPPMIQSALNDLIRRSKSEEDLLALPDTAFAARESFNSQFRSAFGPTSPSAYESTKAAIRSAMKEFAAAEMQTASKDVISSEPVEPSPTGDTSVPEGYDPAQPASLEPAPDAESSPSEPIVKEEEPEPLVVGRKQTETEITDDAALALPDTSPEGSENDSVKVGGKNETAYYHQSVPEISSEEAAKARDAILNKDYEALKEANLQDFVIDNPQFSEIWNALNDRGAFDAVAQINVGDEVELIVDPTFPNYKEKYQILLRNKKTGEILTVLNSNTSRTTYYGITELRKAIDDEYESFREKNPNDVFVFSKTSTVWAKRPGLIEYGFDAEDEKAIQDIPSYEESAPIVFIDRNGNAVSARGNDSALNHVSLDFTNPARNKGDVDGIDRRGNLYYLAADGRGNFIPIRLNVEHFRKENKDSNNPVFSRIKSKLSDIASIGRDTNNTNIGEQNVKLHSAVEELLKDLDLRGVYFELGEFENVGIALRINDGENSVIRRPDQLTDEWLIDHIADFGRSVQIRQDTRGNLRNFAENISNGLITSNAKRLRAKGVDFYINPWIAEKSEFGPVTANQTLVSDELKNDIVDPENIDVEPMPSYDEFGDRDEGNDFLDIQPTESQVSEQHIESVESTVQEAITGRRDSDPVIKMLDEPYSKLPRNIQDALKKKGWTAEQYNKMRKEQPGLVEKELRCAGAGS